MTGGATIPTDVTLEAKLTTAKPDMGYQRLSDSVMRLDCPGDSVMRPGEERQRDAARRGGDRGRAPDQSGPMAPRRSLLTRPLGAVGALPTEVFVTMSTTRAHDAEARRVAASHVARRQNRANRNRVTAALRLLHPEQAGLDDNEIFERLAATLEGQLMRRRDAGTGAA